MEQHIVPFRVAALLPLNSKTQQGYGTASKAIRDFLDFIKSPSEFSISLQDFFEAHQTCSSLYPKIYIMPKPKIAIK